MLDEAVLTANAVGRARTALRRALDEAQDAAAPEFAWLPEREPWALWPDALRLLVGLVRHLRPQHIVEFGSGLSTRVLARAAAQTGCGCITSIDHDPEFSGRARTRLADEQEACPVSFQVAPLVLRNLGGDLLPAYNLSRGEFAVDAAADLVLIDGPPELLGGREGTLYQVLEFARPGTVVLLDDADRAHERTVLDRWQANLGDAVEIERLDLTGGTASIVVRRPVAADELWDHRVRVSCARLVGDLVPNGRRFVMIDDGCLGDAFWAAETAVLATPFLERDGVHWGAPEDDRQAIESLEDLRRTGVTHAVVAWTAFWWLEHYVGLARHLGTRYRITFEDERFAVYDLR